tara:strand:+ start:136 stop:468 length:333 start_codon:yes stop_codon:yes gene_type:complete
MADEIKFSEDEMKNLQEIREKYNSIQLQLGGLKMQQIAAEKNATRLLETEESLMSALEDLSAEEQEVAKTLNDKYGPGSLNPETGIFTPSTVPSEPVDSKEGYIEPAEEG